MEGPLGHERCLATAASVPETPAIDPMNDQWLEAHMSLFSRLRTAHEEQMLLAIAQISHLDDQLVRLLKQAPLVAAPP